MANRAYNIPNLLTYGRIIAVPLIVLCFFLEGRLESSDFARWSALGLFVAASLTDYLDGYLARIWHQTSNIGRMLDPIADKLLVATCLMLLAADPSETIHGWSLWAAIIILCREILVSGLREYLAELRVSVPVSRLAKWKTDHPDGFDRLPAGRSGRRQDFSIHDPDRDRPALDRGNPDAVYRLRLFPSRVETHRGRRMSTVKLVYFAWVRERIGASEETGRIACRGKDSPRSAALAERPRRRLRGGAGATGGDPRSARPGACGA
jgi:cardiolipin synthase